jgi:hypothetical protein
LFVYFIQPEVVVLPKAVGAKKGPKTEELELEIDLGDLGRKTNPKGMILICILICILC